jgi:hypothetical protein
MKLNVGNANNSGEKITTKNFVLIFSYSILMSMRDYNFPREFIFIYLKILDIYNIYILFIFLIINQYLFQIITFKFYFF